MRFEQAFYTRDSELLNTRTAGLGISASSNLEDSFIKKCMDIGGQFDAEGSKRMAEFVLYSEEFKSFVGIGLSPVYSLGKSEIDMICHFFIPMEEESETQRLCSPENYYLLYPFKDNVKKRSELEQVEVPSCFSDNSYQSILKKYHFDQEKLAYFLYKLYPILFDEKNLLLIVLDDKYYEDYSEIAREVTWLASCLVPKAGEQSVPYRKRLSYSVYSQKNISRVNIAYSEQEELHSNRFYFNEEQQEEIPEIYFVLAQKALESQQIYLEFIDQMLESAIEKEINSENLLIMYLLWKLEQKQKISNPEPLVQRAKYNSKYKIKLSLYILLTEELSEAELSNLWNVMISSPLEDITETEKDTIDNALKRMIVLMYNINKKKYKTFIERLPEDSSKKILEELYFLENSCIKKHLNEIKDRKELLDAARLYYSLGEIPQYKEDIKEIASNCLEKIETPRIGIFQKYNKRKEDIIEVEEDLYKGIGVEKELEISKKNFGEREVVDKIVSFEEEVRSRFNKLETEFFDIKKEIEQNNIILREILDIVKEQKYPQFDRRKENNLPSQITKYDRNETINNSFYYRENNNKNTFSDKEKDIMKFDINTKPDYYSS